MYKTKCAMLLVVVLFIAPISLAFEIRTHALLTFDAYQRARLGTDPTLLANLGLRFFTSPPISNYSQLGTNGLDVRGPLVRVRKPQVWEFNAMPLVKDSVASVDVFRAQRDRFTVPGWLMTGAIREDDNPSEGPRDDPYVPNGTFHREFHHLFDPSRNRPLSIAGIGTVYGYYTNGDLTIHRAPDWATGTNDTFATQATRGSDALNHFTTFDAREAMWRALTLKVIASSGTLLDLPPNSIPDNPSPQTLRYAYWATTFRALGDVLHLNQDMAQPQHTRNEAHAGVGGTILEGMATGHESIFEKYIDARARRESFVFPGTGTITTAPLDYSGNPYPIPRFDRYGDYWSTGVAAGSPVDQPLSGYINGKGLADYSNRGFFTVAKNLGSREYDYPSSNPGDYVAETAAYSFPGIASTIKAQYLKGKVADTLVASSTPDTIRMTVQGIFDDVVTEYGITPASLYTLDANVFDDQASLLIPRAVAYSAGLLDYFFRGELQIALPDDGVYAVVDHT